MPKKSFLAQWPKLSAVFIAAGVLGLASAAQAEDELTFAMLPQIANATAFQNGNRF
jgi:hypothetical protein